MNSAPRACQSYYGGWDPSTPPRRWRSSVGTLFGAEHANVQAHSGASANAPYLAAANPLYTLLGISLAHGGHLTHGHPVSFSGRLFKAVQYGVRPEDGRIDYDQVEALAREHRPRLIVAGASAYQRVIDFERFGRLAHETGSRGSSRHPLPMNWVSPPTLDMGARTEQELRHGLLASRVTR
jgi:glycine/serine hydroxymethyltransferase